MYYLDILQSQKRKYSYVGVTDNKEDSWNIIMERAKSLNLIDHSTWFIKKNLELYQRQEKGRGFINTRLKAVSSKENF